MHSHLPGSHRKKHCYSGPYRYKFDSAGLLNQDLVAGPFRQILTALGFPPPATHVSGFFSFQQTTIRVLQDAGFTVDCSLVPNGKVIQHPVCGDFIIADNRRRTDRHAYRPSPADPWAAGDATLLEFPVSGNPGCAYFEMDWASSLEQEFALLQKRLDELDGVDVYQSYWHHFEFSRAHKWTRGSMEQATEFLLKCATWDGLAEIDRPIERYLAGVSHWLPCERRAVRLARGRVLDIGAGAGRHALYLQQKGLRVTAIDPSPAAVQLCRERGLRDVRQKTIEQLSPRDGRFDTVILFGNNFGLLRSFRMARPTAIGSAQGP